MDINYDSKLFIVLRWIFFLPISFLAAGVGRFIAVILSSSYMEANSFMGILSGDLIFFTIFFYVLYYVVPAKKEGIIFSFLLVWIVILSLFLLISLKYGEYVILIRTGLEIVALSVALYNLKDILKDMP